MAPSGYTKMLLLKSQGFWNELLIHHEPKQGLAQTWKGIKENECELNKLSEETYNIRQYIYKIKTQLSRRGVFTHKTSKYKVKVKFTFKTHI